MSKEAKKYLDDFDNHPPEEFADSTDGLERYTERELLHYMQAYADETIDKAIKEIEGVDMGEGWQKGMISKDVIISLLQTLKQLEK